MNNTPNIIKYRNEYWAYLPYCVENLGVTYMYIERHIKSDKDNYKSTRIGNKIYIAINSVPKKHLLGNEDFFAQVCEVVYDSHVFKLRQDFHNACDYSTELCNEAWYEYKSGFKISREKAKEIDQYGNILLQVQKFPYWNYGVNKGDFIQHALEIGRGLCKMFIFKNPKSLLNKLAKMPSDKEELKMWLIPKSYGNTSARIWGREENKMVNTNTGEVAKIDIHERIAFFHWINIGKGNKLNKRQVYDYYKAEIESLGLQPVSLSTMKSYINKRRMFLSLERDGESEFNDKYAPYVPAERLKYSGSQWNADYSGTKLGYWGKKNGKPHVYTLQVLRIIDTATGYWLSYAIADKNESQETTIEGFKKAIEPLQKTAFELITDNGGSFTGSKVALRLSKLFVKHRKIQLGNKQANPAENFVRRVSELSREFDNWVQLGFVSSFKNSNSVANADYAKQGVLASKEDAIEQLEYLRERWNDEKDLRTKKTRYEAFIENQHPDLQELSKESRFFAFANHTEVNVAECRGIIAVQLNYGEYKYQFDDFGSALETISKYCTDQKMNVIVAYSAEEAHIYSTKGDYIMALKRAGLTHKSFAEKTWETEENLNTHLARKSHFKTNAKELTEQIGSDEYAYLFDVKVNNEGKKKQEQRAEHRVNELTKSAKQKVNIEQEETDIDAFVEAEIFKRM
ncbi:MAG TPA: transposase family protein [Crocinitomicaceae bacterium]|nr:transposase family protein [Crocinitomicaceae bacterium]